MNTRRLAIPLSSCTTSATPSAGIFEPTNILAVQDGKPASEYLYALQVIDEHIRVALPPLAITLSQLEEHRLPLALDQLRGLSQCLVFFRLDRILVLLQLNVVHNRNMIPEIKMCYGLP